MNLKGILGSVLLLAAVNTGAVAQEGFGYLKDKPVTEFDLAFLRFDVGLVASLPEIQEKLIAKSNTELQLAVVLLYSPDDVTTLIVDTTVPTKSNINDETCDALLTEFRQIALMNDPEVVARVWFKDVSPTAPNRFIAAVEHSMKFQMNIFQPGRVEIKTCMQAFR